MFFYTFELSIILYAYTEDTFYFYFFCTNFPCSNRKRFLSGKLGRASGNRLPGYNSLYFGFLLGKMSAV